jgi:hypothetical protein
MCDGVTQARRAATVNFHTRTLNFYARPVNLNARTPF